MRWQSAKRTSRQGERWRQKIFRQSSLGDWDGVIARVGDELKRFVQS